MRAIVFALNGCPAGWLGAYGNDWVGTPNLDRLAAESVVFDRHISDSPDPGAARAAWLGALPGRSPLHGTVHTVVVRANHPDTDPPEWFYAGWDEVFDARPQADDVSPLDQLLGAFPAILDRLADVPNFLLWIETDRLIPPWDVPQDVFEAYVADEEPERPPVGNDQSAGVQDNEAELDGPEAAEDEEFDETTARETPNIEDTVFPVSTFHIPDSAVPEEPVTPWNDPPTGPFDRSDIDAWDWLHRSFAAVVTTFDAELGRLFEHLRARGLDQSAAWIVTSDYGHPLGEHGQIGVDRPWLHQELVHVPLLVRLPGAEHAGRRVPAFTQPPDLFPTLLSLLGIAPIQDAKGFNLLPLARGEIDSLREFAVTALELGEAAEIAIRTENWALLVPTRVPEGDRRNQPMLFAKPDDRWEVNDLRSRNLEHADELEAKLREEMQKLAAR